MRVYKVEDTLKAVCENLDRINNLPEGAMYGVAKVWLEDVPVMEVEGVEE